MALMTMSQAQYNQNGCDVLVTGRYFCDLVFTGLAEMPRLGNEIWGTHCELVPGAAFIPAVALHRLGLRVAWPCYFGNDLFSQFVRAEARREGLNEDWFLEYNHPALGITVSFSFSNERAFVSYQDKLPEPSYPDMIRQLQPSWVILVNLWKGKQFEAIIRAARQSQTRVFLECQAHNTSLEDPEARWALQQVDVFSPNAEEALQLTKSSSIQVALGELAALSPMVVIKLGKEGAIAQQGARVVQVPAIEVNVVDTTGAGDNFDCGFIYAQMHGYSLEDSLRCGNISGGLSTRACGGTASSPTAAELEQWRSLY
jgi:hypothetical protein